MKAVVGWQLVALAAVTSEAVLNLRQPAAPAAAPAASPAAAPAAAAPAAPAATAPAAEPLVIQGFSVTFELANYNYNDLEKQCAAAEPQPVSTEASAADAATDSNGNLMPGLKEHAKALSRTTAARVERVSRAFKEANIRTAHTIHDDLNATANAAYNTEVAANDAAETSEVKSAKDTHETIKSITNAVKESTQPTPQTPRNAKYEKNTPHTDVGSSDTNMVLPKDAGKFLQVDAVPLRVPSNYGKDACVWRVLEHSIADAFKQRALFAFFSHLGPKVNLSPPTAPPAEVAPPAPVVAAPAAAPPVVAAPAAAPVPLSEQPPPAFLSADKPPRSKKWGRVEVPPVVDIYVDLQPGSAHKLTDGKGWGRSTLVSVFISDKPGTGGDELPEVIAAFEQDVMAKVFWETFAYELNGVTGIKPEIENLKYSRRKINQWDVGSCAKHMSTVVRRFELAYTRDQVPMALFNECTNFMAKLSFSHDLMPTALDQERCRKTTASFSKSWNFGQGAAQKMANGEQTAKPIDFNDFCVSICETKYGDNAPRCHVSEGKKLATQGK